MEPPIVAENLGKKFRRVAPGRPTTLQETLARGLRGLAPAGEFWALRGVDFEVGEGQMLGVIGANGAGKSTLLRLVGGVGRPDEGEVRVRGRVGALLDLGIGFHPDLTGRENVFVNGVVSGLCRDEVARRFDSIVAFAELEQSIDSPLRTYSTGMRMRLAFAVAAHLDADVLLIDELLSVGDVAFQAKCLDRIRAFKAAGAAILLVSHNLSQIGELCDAAIWIRGGGVAARGPARGVVDEYLNATAAETRRRTPGDAPARLVAGGARLEVGVNRWGSLEMEILSVRLLDEAGRPVAEIDAGSPLRVEIAYRAKETVQTPIFDVTVSGETGFCVCASDTAAAGLTLDGLPGEGSLSLCIDRLDLAAGGYYVDVGVYRQDWSHAYDYHWHVYPLAVRGAAGKGVLHPPVRWTVGSPD